MDQQNDTDFVIHRVDLIGEDVVGKEDDAGRHGDGIAIPKTSDVMKLVDVSVKQRR
jgi:hypothetical protein